METLMNWTVRLGRLFPLLLLSTVSRGFTTVADYPFAPAAGTEGTTAVAKEDPEITGWAVAVADYRPGEAVDEMWRDGEQALGEAEGDGVAVVSLGRGGSLTLTFERPLADRSGWDFAVFENGFGDAFLELAWVEVSSDGETFVRFPNYSVTAGPVGSFGSIDTTKVYGFAGKYRQGYGTPFDLFELAEAYALAGDAEPPFSDTYAAHLRTSFPAIDLNRITHVRIVDVVGDGSARSAARGPGGEGYPIYDPWPTIGSAGADIDAVAVRHFADGYGRLLQELFYPPIGPQVVGSRLRLPEGVSSAGLPVRIRLLEHPEGVEWTEEGLLVTGPAVGTILIEVFQEGSDAYLPAALRIEVALVESGDARAPESFPDWAERYGLPNDGDVDADADGFSNYIEYLAGTRPTASDERPLRFVTSEDDRLQWQWTHNARSSGTIWLMEWTGQSWSPVFGGVSGADASPSVHTWMYELEHGLTTPFIPWRLFGWELNGEFRKEP
jgi:hypothetical protein